MSSPWAVALRMPAACVRTDEQPRAPAADAKGSWRSVATDAHLFAQLCGSVQWPSWPYRHTLGGALQGVSGGLRILLPGLQPLYRAQSGSRLDGGSCGRSSLVKLRGQRRWAPRSASDPTLRILVARPRFDGARSDLSGIVRSEERRVGKVCVSTCRSRWSPYPLK